MLEREKFQLLYLNASSSCSVGSQKHIYQKIVISNVVITRVIYKKTKHFEWVDFSVKVSSRHLKDRWA